MRFACLPAHTHLDEFFTHVCREITFALSSLNAPRSRLYRVSVTAAKTIFPTLRSLCSLR